MKRVLLAVVAIVMALSATAGHAASRSETQPYELGPIGDNFLYCNGLAVEGVVIFKDGNYGGACFAAMPGETSFVATITDDLMPAVGLSVAFYTASGNRIGDFAPGCVEARGAIPAGTAYLGVFADGFVFGALDCGIPLSATTGSITVEFITPDA